MIQPDKNAALEGIPGLQRDAARHDFDTLGSEFTAIWVDPAATEPLYRQVRRFLESRLQQGIFPPNRPLPSSRDLAAALGVSRTTVVMACDELVGQGLFVSKPRSGLYPAASPDAVPPSAQVEAMVSDKPSSSPDWPSRMVVADDPWPLRTTIEPDYTAFPYPFLPGQIDPHAFPARAWLRASAAALDGPNVAFSLRDSVDHDDPLLVDAIRSEILSAKGIDADADQILIVNGAQQALALLADLLMTHGRTVAVENPGYVDASRIFRRAGAELAFFDVDRHGVRPDYSVDFDVLYATPSHHHPTNVTLHADRRHRMLGEAARKDFLIIEDDFDSEVRFRGAPTRPLKSVDQDGRVIYVGTFSKFLAPGLRLGYVVADAALVAALRQRRFYSTKHPAGLLQRTLGLFISSGEFHRVLRQHRVNLKHKWETLDAALTEYLPWPVAAPPAGGLSFWVSGPPGFDATALAVRARAAGVLISPGEAYFLQPNPPKNSFRVGFNSIPQARIVPGIQLLAASIRS